MTTKKNTPAKKDEASQKDAKQKTNPTTPFWKKHIVKLFLAFLLIVSVIWGWVANNQLRKEHREQITELEQSHRSTLQELRTLKNKQVTQTLALAVRSELIDENNDQVNQYFLQILKQPNVEKVMLINHESGEILLSTNKKDETAVFEHEGLYSAKDVTTEQKEDAWYAATPVMGLNNQLAALVVVFSED
ncbi:MAG: hypothetical protein ACQERC_01580 [Bacteroidota bacterium]